jgi:YVTN family beta-propeller protein
VPPLIVSIVLSTATFAQDPTPQRKVHEGIAVDFVMQPIDSANAAFRFAVTDTATGSPIKGARPAAWVDLPRGKQTCNERVKELLAGSILTRAQLDLNSFYVVALNNDATITVVDPLFGYGGTRLLAMPELKSAGYDWSLTPDQSKLFISMPASGQVAVIDTVTWKVARNIDLAQHPSRVAMQPDGRYVWIGEDSGVAVISVSDLKAAVVVPTGRGPHEIAFSDDSRIAFVTNRDDGTVSIVDAAKLAKLKDLPAGAKPASIAYSSLSRLAYVTSETDGAIRAVDGVGQIVVNEIHATAGIGSIRFAPGGRLAFIANPVKDVVQILDASTNRIIQTAAMSDGPDQIAFSSTLAYVRRRASETVLMVPLGQVGNEGKPVPAADFPGGQNVLGKTSMLTPADAIAEMPGENAVVVANPGDKTIYYYKEGMAAPMGNFSNYGREPRAVLVVDRSLRERTPGVYETTAQLRQPGPHRVAFLLDSPRLIECFDVTIGGITENRPHPVRVEPVVASRSIRVGENVRLRFKLTDSVTGEVKGGIGDVRALTFLAPGVWQRRVHAEPLRDGLYEVDFSPPDPGIYYVYLDSPSMGLSFSNPQYLVLEAR